MFRPITLGAALIALAACEAPIESSSHVAPPTLARAVAAGPGNKPVSATRAASYFSALCGQAGKGRANVEAAAAINGFVQNTRTGTYYHVNNDLSVKLIGQRCSIVFVSNDNLAAIRSAFVALKSGRGKIAVRDGGVIGGEHYYRAVIWV